MVVAIDRWVGMDVDVATGEGVGMAVEVVMGRVVGASLGITAGGAVGVDVAVTMGKGVGVGMDVATGKEVGVKVLRTADSGVGVEMGKSLFIRGAISTRVPKSSIVRQQQRESAIATAIAMLERLFKTSFLSRDSRLTTPIIAERQQKATPTP